MQSLLFFFKKPALLFDSLVRHYGKWLPDKTYLKIRFRLKTGRCLNLNNPTGFSEKIQWLKLYDRNPNYTKMVDKYAVKLFVANMIGEQYVIPTIGIWEKTTDINFDILPKQFVLKTTNGGGGNGIIICKDKKRLDKEQACQKLKESLNNDIYKSLREWPYKNVNKRILAEQYLEDESGGLNDYKVLCFGGVAKLIEFHTGRFTDNYVQDFYDREWNKTTISQNSHCKVSHEIAHRPRCLKQMLDFSEKLTEGMPLCRVDWYIVNGCLYFGEITFYDGSGFELFDDEKTEQLLGSWIHLPMNTK